MKKEEKTKLKELSIKELEEKISQLESEIYNLRHQLRLGQLKNYKLIGTLKKKIAYCKTCIREKNGKEKK